MTGAASRIVPPIARVGHSPVIRDDAARSRVTKVALESFQAENAVRDLLARCVRALNQGDVDALMRLFTDDCVVTSPSGTLVGGEALRAELKAHIRGVPRRFHLWPNIVVRLSADFCEADTTAYAYAMLLPRNSPPRSVGGLVVDKIVRKDGEWRISERSTSADLTAVSRTASWATSGSRRVHG